MWSPLSALIGAACAPRSPEDSEDAAADKPGSVHRSSDKGDMAE